VTDETVFMRRALELARIPSFTSPNPRVGAVVVRDGAIIGEGYHSGAGNAHAEAVALDGVDARGATVFVTLEPCSHHGRTPPCAETLVTAGVGRVVAAMEDPDPRVSGAGFGRLRDAGIELTLGVLEDEAQALNRAFVHHRRTGRAFLTLKLALTLDGRVAAQDASPRWITGEASRTRVHERRLEVDAVLVGAGTVETDDPALDVRHVPAPRQPARVVVDTHGRVSPRARIFSGEGNAIVFTAEAPHDVQVAWKEAGAEVMVVPAGTGGVEMGVVLDDLGRRGFVEVLCEGGAVLATSLLRDALVDRLELHYGPKMIGAGGPAIGDLGLGSMSEAVEWDLRGVSRVGDDVHMTLERKP